MVKALLTQVYGGFPINTMFTLMALLVFSPLYCLCRKKGFFILTAAI